MKFSTNSDGNLLIVRDDKKEIVAFIPQESRYARLLLAAPRMLELLQEMALSRPIPRQMAADLVNAVTPQPVAKPLSSDDGYFVLVDSSSGKPVR